MLRKAVTIVGVTVFTSLMLIAATLRVNGGLDTFADFSSHSINSSVVEDAGLARESYLYAQPLLQAYGKLYRDIADQSAAEAVGSFNTLKVLAKIEAESNQSITIKAWLDLRTEPLLLHLPRGGGFVNGVQVDDLYGNTILRHTPDDQEANYLFVTWDWEGEVPLGIRSVVRARTDLLSVSSASRVASAVIYESNKSWAEKVALVPMSAYTMQSQPPLAPGLKLPRWNEEMATTGEFIPTLNFVLRFVHPEVEEAEALKRFQRIGIVAGLPRGPDRYSGAITAGIGQAIEDLKALERDREGLATIGQI